MTNLDFHPWIRIAVCVSAPHYSREISLAAAAGMLDFTHMILKGNVNTLVKCGLAAFCLCGHHFRLCGSDCSISVNSAGIKVQWLINGACTHHGTKNSMEAVLACYPALSTGWVSILCVIWHICTSPINWQSWSAPGCWKKLITHSPSTCALIMHYPGTCALSISSCFCVPFLDTQNHIVVPEINKNNLQRNIQRKQLFRNPNTPQQQHYQ